MSEFNIFVATMVSIISFCIGAVHIVRILVVDNQKNGKIEILEASAKKMEKRMDRYEDNAFKELGNIIRDLVKDLASRG